MDCGFRMLILIALRIPAKTSYVPIILTSDKTTLSDMGDLYMDAIFVTASIFNIVVSVKYQLISNLVLYLRLNIETFRKHSKID